MFREMRRKKQLLSKEDTEAILRNGTAGVLAVAGDDGYPYAVPISYVYADGKIYVHSATAGHKLDAIRDNDKVSFCVIDKDQILPEKFTTLFRSAIAFGRAAIVTDDSGRRHALELLNAKYSPGYEKEGEDEIRSGWDRVCVVEIAIEHLTGKEAIELVRERG